MHVHPCPGADVFFCMADAESVFDNFAAGGNIPDCHFMSCRNCFQRRDRSFRYGFSLCNFFQCDNDIVCFIYFNIIFHVNSPVLFPAGRRIPGSSASVLQNACSLAGCFIFGNIFPWPCACRIRGCLPDKHKWFPLRRLWSLNPVPRSFHWKARHA